MRCSRMALFAIGVMMSQIAAGESYSKFAQSGLNEWEPVEFEGETRYVLMNEGDATVLKASSSGSASGLVKKQTVDLRKTPILEWRWRVDQALPVLPEETKKGDDYAARIYVIVKDGWFFWQTKALNYVWSSRDNPPESWPNAFAPDNARMLPVRNAQHGSGQWFTERRNIREDLKQQFGKTYDEIEAIAIMTDTDNSGLSAQASYGELTFIKEHRE
ncbi:MAG: DUF3047 domain-containing protein [Oleiphilaceae bacterium]|nr:DUF3047 domain-containing protein [Oleiphilaceae bacterium]